MKDNIEKAWITENGYWAVIRRIGSESKIFMEPWRCGYVGLPKGHPLCRVNYSDEKLSNISVHGGLTFSEEKLKGAEGAEWWFGWWFGFDCAHWGDTPDKCTLEYCVEQCESLAKQLINSFEIKDGAKVTDWTKPIQVWHGGAWLDVEYCSTDEYHACVRYRNPNFLSDQKVSGGKLLLVHRGDVRNTPAPAPDSDEQTAQRRAAAELARRAKLRLKQLGNIETSVGEWEFVEAVMVDALARAGKDGGK